MSKEKSVLPPLLFGQNRSLVDLDLDQMQSRVNSITNWVSEYDTLDKSKIFQHRTSVFSNDGLRLIAVASTPTVMKVNDPDYTIALPLQGSIESWIQGQHINAHTGTHAVFNPKGARHTEGGDKNVLLISVTEKRILDTAKIMLGERYVDFLDLNTPRLINTKFQSIDFRKVLGQVCNLIDQFHGDQTLLRSFNVDENIVRLIVMMLTPEQFIKNSQIEIPQDNRSQVIEHLCDYLASNINQALNLTTMETVSGLSARILQTEFQKRFGCSPIQWIKQQRLSQAHDLLRNAHEQTTISSIAAQCGYSNFSEFSRQYQEKFGLLPSETLKLSK
jgi:AraC-like DNA-binding protein